LARPLRIQYAHAFCHITGRGNERKKVFSTKADYDRFKEYLKEAQTRFGFILHAYVLMGNHYHLIGETPEANLSAIMHSINGAYTTYFNKKRKRSGHLFQGRYKAILIDHDSYLLELSRYIHLNPVKAGMVERPEDYAFSSYASYIFPDKEDIASRDLIWNMTSTENAPVRYKAFVEEAMNADKAPCLFR
jgi:putative transposase